MPPQNPHRGCKQKRSSGKTHPEIFSFRSCITGQFFSLEEKLNYKDGAKTGFLSKIQFLLRLKKRIPWCVRTEDSYGTALHLIAQLTKICSNIAATRK